MLSRSLPSFKSPCDTYARARTHTHTHTEGEVEREEEKWWEVKDFFKVNVSNKVNAGRGKC